MSRLIKGTATDDTLTMVFHYDGMGNRIRKDVWREVPGGTGGLQDRVSDIYVRDAQGNILAVYKEQALVNGGATIDWLNSQLYQVATVPELAVFYSTQFGNNGNFSGNLYDYGLLEAPDWASAQLSERSGRFYINQSDYMFGHALETQLAEAWADLRDMDPAEFLPLLKENEGDLGRTGRLVSAALQSSSISVNTLEHLSNTDNDFMAALFQHLPDGYRIEDAQKVVDMGQEGRMAQLSQMMSQQGTSPIADAFVQASLNTPPNSFLESWLYDDKVFNSTNLANDDELKKNLKDCIKNSENAPALTVVREQFGNWMDATLPHYVEESFTPQDRLNVVYNSDKVAFLESFIGTNGMAGITGALVQIPGLTGLSYSNTIINSVSLGYLNSSILQYVNTPSPQNIDTDTLWLAEHHLYGSSRLGIKQYAAHQYRNVYSNTQSFVKGINLKQPWYNYAMDEEIKSGIKAIPLLSTHYLTDSFRYKRDLGTKYYELSDHLGNVLATVLDRKTGCGSLNGEYAGFRADIASATDYYPFGMEMPGRTFSSTNSRFGYNGQEKDNEIKGIGSSLDFGARIYDPRISMFLSVDPLMKEYPNWTPYSFAANSPIQHVDMLGAHPLSFHVLNMRRLIDQSPNIKVPFLMDIEEMNNGRNFNSSHLYAVKKYYLNNWSAEKRSSAYGYNENSYHDCITSFSYALSNLYTFTRFRYGYVENAVVNGKLHVGAYNDLKRRGYVASEKTVNMLTSQGNRAVTNDRVTKLDESIAEYSSRSTPDNRVGFFGVSLMGGFHTMMLVVDKRSGETSFRLLDQHSESDALDRTKDLSAQEVDQYFIKFADANRAVGAARTVKAFELRRVPEKK